MTKRPFKWCTYIFSPISIFFAYTFLFLKKELIRSASCITVFATVVSSLWKWESLSAFFGSKIFHHHRHFDTVHCSNLVIKMLEIRCVYPEIMIILNANSSYDLADMRKATWSSRKYKLGFLDWLIHKCVPNFSYHCRNSCTAIDIHLWFKFYTLLRFIRSITCYSYILMISLDC